MLMARFRRFWPLLFVVAALYGAIWGAWSSRQNYIQNNYAKYATEYKTIDFVWPNSGVWTAIFTCMLTISTIGLWSVTKIAANAARKAADAAERSLVAVERPILIINIPKYVASTTGSGKKFTTKLTFTVNVENIGKQFATLHVGSAVFIVQSSPRPPALSFLYPQDGTDCPLGWIGEMVVRPRRVLSFVCERQTALSAEETRGINEKTMFGFFRVAFFYDDAIGTSRASNFIFVLRPPIGPGIFAQVLNSDQVTNAGTIQEQKNRQRNLIEAHLRSEASGSGKMFP